MRRIARVYNGYAVVLGMTSYVSTSGNEGFRQTRITQAYAFVVNLITLIFLPLALWKAAHFQSLAKWLPKFMWITPYVLYSVNYGVTFYTLISRYYRDAILLDLHAMILKLNREFKQSGMQMDPNLRRVFYIKTFTLTYLCFGYFLALFIFQWGQSWAFFLDTLLINTAYSILITNTYFYFVSFWQIAKGFDLVSQQFAEIVAGRLEGRAEELRNLWALHEDLCRVVHQINRYYGPQMLFSRFDYFMFTVLNGYMGMVFAHSKDTLIMEKWYGAFIFWIRSVDFFLNDYICHLVTQYQSGPKIIYFEDDMTQEVNI
ncbi:putative gustatory receptor 59b [Drosophila bipectinata]|uniref:putative gustatory receptor 59b n=1 Tax=Drosophila bipectinata TaxID=42026 RepID=UPI001C89E9F5|nr:putative gustatory receptor 59b [Drosophila bipectinata]